MRVNVPEYHAELKAAWEQRTDDENWLLEMDAEGERYNRALLDQTLVDATHIAAGTDATRIGDLQLANPTATNDVQFADMSFIAALPANAEPTAKNVSDCEYPLDIVRYTTFTAKSTVESVVQDFEQRHAQLVAKNDADPIEFRYPRLGTFEEVSNKPKLNDAREHLYREVVKLVLPTGVYVLINNSTLSRPAFGGPDFHYIR